MLKAFQNFIIFKTDQLFNDKVKMKAGGELYFDPSFNPAVHARIYGEVVSVPIRLSPSIPISQKHAGLPGYNERSPYSYKYMADIEQDVRVGDRIYYHFNTIKIGNIVKEEGAHPNKTWYLKVRYDQVICAVRNGEIICIGGHTLVDPDFETWDDITIQVPTALKDASGQTITRPVITKAQPTYKFLRGTVRHVGKPLKGDVCEVKPGQKILYHRHGDWLVKIEDRDYFVIKQRHLTGRWE